MNGRAKAGPARPTRSKAGSRSNAARVPFALLLGGLLVGGLVLLLALNTASAANELRRSALAVQDQEVSADVAQLHNEVAASAAPGNLADAAQQLGMVPADHPAFIVELPGGRTVLRGHARAVADDPLDIPTGTRHASPTPTTRLAAPQPTSKSTSTSTPTSTPTSAPKSTSKSTPTATRTGTTTPTKHQHRTSRRSHPTTRGAQPTTPTTSATSASTGGHA